MNHIGAFLVTILVVQSFISVSAEKQYPPGTSTTSRFPNLLAPLRNIFSKRPQSQQSSSSSSSGGLFNGILPFRLRQKDLKEAETNHQRVPVAVPPNTAHTKGSGAPTGEYGLGGYRPYMPPQNNPAFEEPFQQAEEDHPYQYSFQAGGRPGPGRRRRPQQQKGPYNGPGYHAESNMVQNERPAVGYSNSHMGPAYGQSQQQRPNYQGGYGTAGGNGGMRPGKGKRQSSPKPPMFQYPSLRNAQRQKGFRPSRPDHSKNTYDTLGFLPGESFNPAEELGSTIFDDKPRGTRSEPQIITMEDLQKHSGLFQGGDAEPASGFYQSQLNQQPQPGAQLSKFSQLHPQQQQFHSQPNDQGYTGRPQQMIPMNQGQGHGRPFRRGRGKRARNQMNSYSKQVPTYLLPSNPNPIFQSRPLRSHASGGLHPMNNNNYVIPDDDLTMYDETRQPDQRNRPLIDSKEEILYGKPMAMSSNNQQMNGDIITSDDLIANRNPKYLNQFPLNSGSMEALPASAHPIRSDFPSAHKKPIHKPFLLKATTKIPSFKKLPSSYFTSPVGSKGDKDEPQQAASSFGNFGGGGGGGNFAGAGDDFNGSNNGDRILFHVAGHKGPYSYRWGYDTGKGYNRMFRFEEKDDSGYVKGKYGYQDKHGKMKVVHYEAHPEDGYHEEPTGHN